VRATSGAINFGAWGNSDYHASRPPVFWNTLIYKSDQVTIQNYKVINRRPTTTTFNQTDGVDFDASTNGNLFNAFLYTGDDNMATKTEQEGGIDTKNIVHQKVVAYSNSGACKIGTKTFGAVMDGVVFKDIDVVKAGRAIAIDANDTAVIQNTTFQNVRVEAADTNLIDVETDRPPTFRTAPNTSTVKDVFFTSVSSDVKQLINIHGKSATVNVNGVHFNGLTVQGQPVTSQTDTDASWDINQFVSNVTFQ
jgi:polygalacturonase